MERQMKPQTVNILGITYRIEYVDKPSEVDIFKRDSLWGQIDFWTRTIRIFDSGRPDDDVFHVLMHEVLHGIASELKLKSLDASDKEKHDDLDVLALALTDVLFRNEWIRIDNGTEMTIRKT
jgi:hypothetical protein